MIKQVKLFQIFNHLIFLDYQKKKKYFNCFMVYYLSYYYHLSRIVLVSTLYFKSELTKFVIQPMNTEDI